MLEVSVMYMVGDAVMVAKLQGSKASFQRIDGSVMVRFQNRDGKVVQSDSISMKDNGGIVSANFRQADLVIMREVGKDVQS